jgi:hypothetical protein
MHIGTFGCLGAQLAKESFTILLLIIADTLALITEFVLQFFSDL